MSFRIHSTSSNTFKTGTIIYSQRQVRLSIATASAVPRSSIGNVEGSKLDVSSIINGCWQLAGGHGSEVFQGIESKLEAHARAGFTTFDTADIYGKSEAILGDFSAQWREKGNKPVEILTKYVPNIFQSKTTPANIEAAVRKSMRNLKTDCLDSVQMHWWDYSIPGMEDAAKSLADLQAKGLIKQIACTNMDSAALARIVDAGVPIASNQVQFSLLDRRPLNGMIQYCETKGIKLISYGSVAGGLLSDKHVVVKPKEGGMFNLGRARYPTVDLNTSSLKMYWNTIQKFGGQELWRELLIALSEVASRHNVSVSNVALRWVMQQGNGDTVRPLVGLRGVEHIEDNERSFSFSLSNVDMAKIDEVLSRSTGPKGDVYSFERGE
jgi:aryl-alcohol dehydrogenase-like predicted oxidoreductase